MVSTTRPVRILTTARAVRWAGSQYRLAAILKVSRQAISLWGRWPPKDRQYEISKLMRSHKKAPAREAA